MRQDLGIGKLITTPQSRDAIHVAVIAVTVDRDMEPGTHVAILGATPRAVGTDTFRSVGIIDPFLTCTVKKGERCWVFIHPNTVTSLRHEWTHPGVM